MSSDVSFALHDGKRLAALGSYRIMNTEPEEAFDDLARLAALACRTPAAFVVFADDETQFIKASADAGAVRDATLPADFCLSNMASDDVLVISDALADPLYARNPAVTAAATDAVRAYAGVPIRSPDGFVLGVVCAVDRKPRLFDMQSREALGALGRQAEALLALRRQEREQAQLAAERNAFAQDRDAVSAARDAANKAREQAEQERLRAGEERERSRKRVHQSETMVRERERRVRALYELTARADLDFPEKTQRLLQAGYEWLHLNMGVLARTDCDAGTYEVVQIYQGGEAASDAVPIGFTCALDDTFCSETIKRGPESPPIAVENAGASEIWRDHPAYKAFGSEAYLATVVWVGGKAWGTLAFVSRTPRSEPFSEFDKDMARLIAQWIGGELARLEAEDALRATVTHQRRFVREILASVTEGKLRLCDSANDLPAPLAPASEPVALTPASLRVLRKRAEAAAHALHFGSERIHDLLTAVGEAGMNAIKHGGGGVGSVHADLDTGLIQVWIVDKGTGIRDEDLPRATLEKGWSGAGSLGHGFFLMLRTVDRTFLLTGANGTTVVLEQASVAPQPAWFQAVTLNAV